MKLEEYFKIKDFLKITLINDICVLLSVEDGELIIELSRDENYFEKVCTDGYFHWRTRRPH